MFFNSLKIKNNSILFISEIAAFFIKYQVSRNKWWNQGMSKFDFENLKSFISDACPRWRGFVFNNPVSCVVFLYLNCKFFLFLASPSGVYSRSWPWIFVKSWPIESTKSYILLFSINKSKEKSLFQLKNWSL